jgi:uncharacterized MnhB-related membrane protein
MVYILCVVGVLVCAVQAIRSQRLLVAALWLAGTSALTALLLYLLGAPDIAVVELSVGAGLVTVLFVFAINIAGEETLPSVPAIPRWLAWLFAGITVLLLGWFAWQGLPDRLAITSEASFNLTLWQDRRIDLLLQIVLLFCGSLSVLGLMAEEKPHLQEKEKDA